MASMATTPVDGAEDAVKDDVTPECEDPQKSDEGAPPLTQDQRIAFARAHYEAKGYRVHSGLQFGCALVLYADDPSRVHSDFCVHVASGPEGRVDWRTVQTQVRSMSDFHKTLIVAHVRPKKSTEEEEKGHGREPEEGEKIVSDCGRDSASMQYEVAELAIATEHAPFRHKTAVRRKVEVGSQVKKRTKQS